MTLATPTTQIEQAAIERLAEAKAENQRLRLAVANGDDSVTAADLAEAAAAVELAALKVTNARRVGAEEAAKARQAAVHSFVQRATTVISSTGDTATAVAEAKATAVDALSELYEAAKRHRDSIVAIAQAGEALGLDQHNEHNVQVRTQPGAVAVRVGAVQVDVVDPLARVAQVVAKVLGGGSQPLHVEANRFAQLANRQDDGDVVRIPMMSPQQRQAQQQRHALAAAEESRRTQAEAEERARVAARAHGKATF